MKMIKKKHIINLQHFIYFKNAADKGKESALFEYSKMIEKNEIQIEKEEAARYYKIAVDKGNDGACINYAKMLDEGDFFFLFDKQEAARYYKIVADKGNTNAMIYYATIYDNRDEVQTDKKKQHDITIL